MRSSDQVILDYSWCLFICCMQGVGKITLFCEWFQFGSANLCDCIVLLLWFFKFILSAIFGLRLSCFISLFYSFQVFHTTVSRRFLTIQEKNCSRRKKKTLSTSKILKSLVDAPCRSRTTKRHLNDENIQYKKRTHCPRFTMKQKQKRLEYAGLYQTISVKEWRKIVFSNVKKFNLDGPDAF